MKLVINRGEENKTWDHAELILDMKMIDSETLMVRLTGEQIEQRCNCKDCRGAS